MKFTISKGALVEKLNLLPSLPNNIVPILNCIKIDAGDNLVLTATDLVVLTRIITSATIKEKGIACVPLRNFISLVKEMPDGDLTIETTKAQLHVKSEKVKLRMNIFEAEQFPQFENEKATDFVLPIEAALLVEHLASSSIAMGVTVGFDINGMLLDISTADGVRFVSTDGKRLAFSRYPLSKEAKVQDSRYVLPARVVGEFAKAAKHFGAKVALGFSKGFISLQASRPDESIFIRTLLLEDKYPNYMSFIPKESESKVLVNRREFIASLNRSNVLTNETDNPLKVKLSTNKLELNRRNANVGDIEDNLEVTYSGKEMQVGFEVKCILDVLNILTDEQVAVEITGPDTPFVIRKKDYLYLALPIIL